MNKTKTFRKTIRRTGRKAIRRTGRKIVRGGGPEILSSREKFNDSKDWAEKWQVCDNHKIKGCTVFLKDKEDVVSKYFEEGEEGLVFKGYTVFAL